MKLLTFVGSVFLLHSCSDLMSEGRLLSQEVHYGDLSEHNMKIIPEKPTGNDEVRLVIFDDCKYNVLSGVARKDNSIEIQKQFNSMMKCPCFQTNDTILIGNLLEGTYHVKYTLIDISQQAPRNISVSFSFQLNIAR